VANLWLQPLDGGEPRPLTDFTSDGIRIYAWSPGGDRLVLGRGAEITDIVLISDIR
jgi:dipeptidyl aminopeptidase/acylaminoacyl peptidase